MKTLEKLNFKSVRYELILLAILFLGLLLRIYDLGSESIWLDEGFSIEFASSSLLGVLRNSAQDAHPPLYYVILHYWISLFGDSEFSIRFPAAMFGFFAILMIYKVGSQIYDKQVGIVSSLIVGLSVFHIHYSQDARMYSLTAFLTLVSMFFFVRLFRERGFVVSIGYILPSILLIYTHYYGLFIVLAQNIYVISLFLLSKKTYGFNFRRWILLQVIIIILFAPWIVVLIEQILRVESGLHTGWIPVPTISSIKSTVFTYSGSALLFLLFLILASLSLLANAKISGRGGWKNLFKSIGSHKLSIRLSHADRAYLMLVWLLTPIALPFVISRFSAPVYHTRFTIGASLAFYLLVANGIRSIDNKYVKLIIIGVVIIGSTINVWRYYPAVDKERWREVANYIDVNAEQGDLLLFNTYTRQIPFDYYSKRVDLVKSSFAERNPKYFNEEHMKNLRSMAEGYDRVWIVLSRSSDPKGLIKKTLGHSYALSFHKEYVNNSYNGYEYVGVEVYLFEKNE